MNGTATLSKTDDPIGNMHPGAVEYLLLTLFHESFRDAVKIGEQKATHFRGNIGGAGVKNDRSDGKKHERKWHPEQKLAEAAEDLHEHLEHPIFKRTVEILGRDPQKTIKRFKQIMNGEDLEEAKKTLNLLKKHRQRLAQNEEDRKDEQEKSIRQERRGRSESERSSDD